MTVLPPTDTTRGRIVYQKIPPPRETLKPGDNVVATNACTAFTVEGLPQSYVQATGGSHFEVGDNFAIALSQGQLLLRGSGPGISVKTGLAQFIIPDGAIALIEGEPGHPTRFTLLSDPSNTGVLALADGNTYTVKAGEKLVAQPAMPVPAEGQPMLAQAPIIEAAPIVASVPEVTPPEVPAAITTPARKPVVASVPRPVHHGVRPRIAHHANPGIRYARLAVIQPPHLIARGMDVGQRRTTVVAHHSAPGHVMHRAHSGTAIASARQGHLIYTAPHGAAGVPQIANAATPAAKLAQTMPAKPTIVASNVPAIGFTGAVPVVSSAPGAVAIASAARVGGGSGVGGSNAVVVSSAAAKVANVLASNKLIQCAEPRILRQLGGGAAGGAKKPNEGLAEKYHGARSALPNANHADDIAMESGDGSVYQAVGYVEEVPAADAEVAQPADAPLVEAADGSLTLQSGTALIRPDKATTVHLPDGSVLIRAHAAVLVSVEDKITRVMNLYDKSTSGATLLVGRMSIPLVPGAEANLVNSNPDALGPVVMRDGIARRHMRLQAFGAGKYIATDEFSLISALNRNPRLSALKSGTSKERNLVNAMVKEAAALTLITDLIRGPYTAGSIAPVSTQLSDAASVQTY